MRSAFTHVHSIRLLSGHEALVARVLTKEGKAGFGFSMRLDAAEARHMADWDAGVRSERPRIEPLLGHPWETAWVAGEPVDWNAEPAFAQIRWLPEEISMISYKRPDGTAVSAYLAEPKAGKNAAGVVVIQEWWGLNDQIRGVADKLAAAGYRALVPDLYRGKVAVEAKEAEHLMSGLNFGEAAGQDVRGAVQYLKSTGSKKVGVTGFCMGGALTLLAAVNVPEADAAVAWYGYPSLEYVDATKIKSPLMAHWATKDDFFVISKVDELEKKLRDAKVKFEFHRYNAKHAFANETALGPKRPVAAAEYDAKAAELAWKRTLEFFGKNLK